MLIGYARVSTQDQETAAQIAALKTAGCELIFQEKASGGRWDRPELHRLLGQLRKDDVLVVWKLDRLSRLLKDVLSLMEKIAQAQAGFRSLSEAIDTTSAGGRMMMQIVASFAEFERAMLRERTRSGLDEARKQGRLRGDATSSGPTSRKKLSAKFTRVRKPQQQLGSSTSLPRPSHVFCSATKFLNRALRSIAP